MKTFETLVKLTSCLGQEIGVSPYLTITQDMINDFAKATGDHQWIHVDVEKARQFSPFKTPVAHGFLTLSLAPRLMADLFRVLSVKMGVNYGANKVRFTSVVPSGSQVRMRATLLETEEVPNHGLKIIVQCIFELEGQEKPACVAELISVLYE
ncbi:MaoC family dehydratase [Telluribacter sp.]|jgi:acyl dehydratase|uniref:MaoC family dehydratase n=1 Tax=Telluribacter sp. TaxID=1978767 RepID=UPI002E0F4BB9|nr:MaoC family dehydratase [Telluribacter sp.]